LGPLTYAHTAWDAETKLWLLIKLDERKFFTGPGGRIFFVTRMLTRGLFAVANLLDEIAYRTDGLYFIS